MDKTVVPLVVFTLVSIAVTACCLPVLPPESTDEPETVVTEIPAVQPTETPTAAPATKMYPDWTAYSDGNVAYDMVFDDKGHLWAVGYGGVVRWDTESGSHAKYAVEDGLALNAVESWRMSQVASTGLGVLAFAGRLFATN